MRISRTSTLLLVIIFTVIPMMLMFWLKSIIHGIIIAITVLLILWISKPIWLPQNYGNTLIRKLSLLLGYSIITFYYSWWGLLAGPLNKFLATRFPDLNLPEIIVGNSALTGPAFFLILAWIVNYRARGKTTVTPHKRPFRKDFKDPEFLERLSSFKHMLEFDLTTRDKETNWTQSRFTPLRAKVEIRTEGKYRRSLAGLMPALKRVRSASAVLVIGDPGSGKSVALRRLGLELLKEIDRAHKIPIYIDLREWRPKRGWSEKNLPRTEDLHLFLKEYLVRHGDIETQEFINEYFEDLYKGGRFFFILDSFDEIPEVLNEPANSPVINELSKVIFKGLGTGNGCRGVLASREFRRPTESFGGKITLYIQPFSEEQISRTLNQNRKISPELVQELFRDRHDLIPLAKNPFTCMLLSRYIEFHQKLPLNRRVMYSDYVIKSLEKCTTRSFDSVISTDDAIAGCRKLARVLLGNSDIGLEARVKDLEDRLPEINVEVLIDMLKYAKIGRVGSDIDRRFCFSHRRFTEYFVAESILAGEISVDIHTIPTDSGQRDALVMYAEVCPRDRAVKLAEYCWQEIKKTIGHEELDTNNYLHRIHCIRFLTDAFHSRTDCLISFINELGEDIISIVEPGKNLVLIKHSVESSPILNDEHRLELLIKALRFRVGWIYETAIRSCRYLPNANEKVRESLIQCLYRIPIITQLRQSGNMRFALGLAGSTRDVKRFYTILLFSIIAFLLCFSIVFILFPLVSMLIILIVDLRLMSYGRRILDISYRDIKRTIPRAIAICTAFAFPIFAVLNTTDIAEYKGKINTDDTAYNSYQSTSDSSVVINFLVDFFELETPADPPDSLDAIDRFYYFAASLRQAYESNAASILLFPLSFLEFTLIRSLLVVSLLLIVVGIILPQIAFRNRRTTILRFVRAVFEAINKFVLKLKKRPLRTIVRSSFKLLYNIAFGIVVLLISLALFIKAVLLVGNFLSEVIPSSVWIVSGVIVLVLIVISIFVETVRWILPYIHDKKYMNGVIVVSELRREIVDDQFNHLKTYYYEKKYLQTLLENNVQLTGNWNDASLLNLQNTCGELIAKLEERSLKLSR